MTTPGRLTRVRCGRTQSSSAVTPGRSLKRDLAPRVSDVDLAARELWLGEGTRGPPDRSGIYQLVARCGPSAADRMAAPLTRARQARLPDGQPQRVRAGHRVAER
jgi:hypothetical protein